MQKDNLEILLEDINGKFSMVLECYAALDKKIDDKFDELNAKVDYNTSLLELLIKK